MTSAISSVSSMVNSLFSRLDTTNQGYIDKAGLKSAFDQISSSDSTSSTSDTSVDTIFSKFDSDSDGKITKQEMTDGITSLANELNNQFNQSRLTSSTSNSLENTSGYTKDELTSMVDELGSTDSKRTSLMTSIANNFDAADTDGNGKVSNQEAMAYEQSTQTSSTSSTGSTSTVAQAGGTPPPPPPPQSSSSSSDSSSSSSSTTYAAADTNQDGTVSAEEQFVYETSQAASTSESKSVMKMVVQLLQAYSATDVSSAQAASNSISVIA